eukprot:scaffold37078_cov117-Cyclotella_meneghiniana.AAC.5
MEYPWWNEAVADPKKGMPKTIKYLEDNFEGEEYEKKLKQIKLGIKAGRDELLKITKRYLMKAPMVLLVLCNRRRGPAFLRAVLSILQHEYPVEGVQLFNETEEDWGNYIYADKTEQPDDEKIWYDLLTKDAETTDDLIHFWRHSA